MKKKPLQSKPLKSLKNERWKPYIRYQKETDTWITKAIKEVREGKRILEETMDQIPSKIKVLMDRKQLDIMARLVAYMYHEKKDEYEKDASDLRKEHIYRDLTNINEWLGIQYRRIGQQEEKDKKINTLDQEIIDGQSK